MRAAFQEYVGVLNPPNRSMNESVDDVRAAMAKGGAVIAWIDERAVGSGRWQNRGDHVYAERISVVPEARGTGIGAAIMRAIEGIAEEGGFPEIRLSTRGSLPRNVAFYERLGYRVTGTNPHPRGPDTEVHLAKRLLP